MLHSSRCLRRHSGICFARVTHGSPCHIQFQSNTCHLLAEYNSAAHTVAMPWQLIVSAHINSPNQVHGSLLHIRADRSTTYICTYVGEGLGAISLLDPVPRTHSKNLDCCESIDLYRNICITYVISIFLKLSVYFVAD